MENARDIQEIASLLEKCSNEKLKSIGQFDALLVGLSVAKLDYLIELANLLFGQSTQ